MAAVGKCYQCQTFCYIQVCYILSPLLVENGDDINFCFLFLYFCTTKNLSSSPRMENISMQIHNVSLQEKLGPTTGATNMVGGKIIFCINRFSKLFLEKN